MDVYIPCVELRNTNPDVIAKERSNLEARFPGWTYSNQTSNLSCALHYHKQYSRRILR